MRKIFSILLAISLIYISGFTGIKVYAENSDRWQYYLGQQDEYGLNDSRDCWLRLFRKNLETGEKQQISFKNMVSKFVVLDDCIIYSETDYDGAVSGKTYGLYRVDKDGSKEVLLDIGYDIKFDVRQGWIYYTSGKNVNKIKTDGSIKKELKLQQQNLWLVGYTSFFIFEDYLYLGLWHEVNNKCEGSSIIRINLNNEQEESLFLSPTDIVWHITTSEKHRKICYQVKEAASYKYDVYTMDFDGSNKALLVENSDDVFFNLHIPKDWVYFGSMNMSQGKHIKSQVFRVNLDGSKKETIYESAEQPFWLWKNKIIFEDWKCRYITDVDLPDTILERIQNAIVLKVDDCDTITFGKYKGVDEADASVFPFVENGHTLVPVRFISEALGAQVKWDENSNNISIAQGEKTIRMTIGSNEMLSGDEIIHLETSPQIKRDRTFIPLRALIEALGKKVFWYDGLIVISDNESIFNSTTEQKDIMQIKDEFFSVGLF